MSLTLSESAKATERQLPEAGTTMGVLVQLIDMGCQKTNWDGEEKWSPKVRLTFELPDQVIEGEVVENGKTTKVTKPMMVSLELTRSLGERATLRKHLESWRGAAFTSKELASFSLKNLLGKAALLTLMHKTSQAGRQYCAINAISKLPKGMTAPKESVNSHVFYEIENGQNEVFAALPEWLQDKVRASKEFQMATGKSTASKAELDADGNQVPF
ncbi:MAG: hypothetical protein EBZ61_11425 [Micrococcales bacterium]|nr:hypothetical protein [Micrococcales bacterium]